MVIVQVVVHFVCVCVYFLFFVVGQFFRSANLICLFFLWPFGKYLQEVGDTHFSRSDPCFEISQYLKMV
jgi:hypothetical protein